MALRSLSGLSLRDLEYAVAIADLQHFGRAAARCGVSQAGLSEQVRKLESLLGCPLFERTTRRIVQTPKGEALINQARTVLRDARSLLEMARDSSDPLSGPLHLGVIATLGPYYLPSLLCHVRARFPALQLRLQEGLTVPLLQDLQTGALDVLLAALPLHGDGVVTQPLFFEPFLALMPRQQTLATKARIGLADLAGKGLLLLEEGHCLRDQALSLCQQPSVGGEARFATSLEMLRHMIAAGEGHSLVPLLATRGHSESDGLVAVRDIDDPEVGRTIGIAWRSSDPRAAAFSDVAAFLRANAPVGTRSEGALT